MESKSLVTCLFLVGWVKNGFSSETKKIILGTTFSHYLGIKHCRKPKIENFYTFFHPVQAFQSFCIFGSIYLLRNQYQNSWLWPKNSNFIFCMLKLVLKHSWTVHFLSSFIFFLVYSTVCNRSCRSAGSLVKILIRSKVILMPGSAANLSPQMSHLRGLVPSWTDSTMYFQILHYKFHI